MNYYNFHYNETNFYVGDGQGFNPLTYTDYTGRFAHLFTFAFESAPLELFAENLKQTFNFDWYIKDIGESSETNFSTASFWNGSRTFDSEFDVDPTKIAPNWTMVLFSLIAQTDHSTETYVQKTCIAVVTFVPIKLYKDTWVNYLDQVHHSVRRSMPSIEDKYPTYICQVYFQGDRTSGYLNRHWTLYYGDAFGETTDQPIGFSWQPLSNFWKRAIVHDEESMVEPSFRSSNPFPMNIWNSAIDVHKNMSIPTPAEEIDTTLLAQKVYEEGQDHTVWRSYTVSGYHWVEYTMDMIGFAYRPVAKYVQYEEGKIEWYHSTSIIIGAGTGGTDGHDLCNPYNGEPYHTNYSCAMLHTNQRNANFPYLQWYDTNKKCDDFVVVSPGDVTPVTLPPQSSSTEVVKKEKDEQLKN